MLRLLAVAALLVLPGVGAKTVPPEQAAFEATVEPAEVDTTLYFHPLNGMDMPVNTQVPQYGLTEMSGFGAGAMTLTCLRPYTGGLTGGMTSQELHTYRGYSSPSFVEYDAPGGIRTWPERGFSYNIPLNHTAPVVLHWFMAESSGSTEVPRAPLANVVVKAVMMEPASLSLDDKGYDTGRVIMEGATAPVTAFGGEVAGDGSTQVAASEVDGRWVYDFAIPLGMQVDVLNNKTGFNVRIDVAVDNPACQEGSIMPSTAEPYADEAHQPRIELRNGVPLRIEYAAVREDATGRLRFGSAVNSGWGNYDVAVNEATLDVFGPVDAVADLNSTIQRYREYYHFMDPVEQDWTLRLADLPDGRYTAVYSVPNLQHTATAEARLTFNVQNGRLIEGELQEAPGISPLALLAIVAALGLLRRRR